MKTQIEQIENEVMTAYCDCNNQHPFNCRNLNFRASGAVSRDDAARILSKAIPDGYNEFNFSLLNKFPRNAQFVIAREGSVCLYISGDELPSAAKVLADEKSQEGVETRFWWD